MNPSTTTRQTRQSSKASTVETTWGEYVEVLCEQAASPDILIEARTPRPHCRVRVHKDKPDEVLSEATGNWTAFISNGLVPSDFTAGDDL